MKTIILCGGKGARLREMTEKIPKPMVEIGNKPILWHIMKLYASQGFTDFILATGYKREMIENYFQNNPEPWNITCVDTDEDTNTGGRIKKVQPYLEDDDFMVTYGDGLANINLTELLEKHHTSQTLATITVVRPHSQFGIVDLDEHGIVEQFREKPLLDQWINGGFFVFKKEVLNHINDNDVLETTVFEKLAAQRQIAAYKLDGFWNCMDTFKDIQILNELWDTNKAEWKLW